MQLVEKHIIKNDAEIDNLSFLSKNLYNYSNYILRQAFIGKKENIPEFSDLINDKNFIGEYELSKRMAKLNQNDYRGLPIQTSQNIIKLLYNNWKSFFQAIKDFNKNPEKYNGKPCLPRYKDKKKGRNILIFTNQNCRLKDGFVKFPKQCKMKPVKTVNATKDNFCQVRIIPRTNCYAIEIVYEKEVKQNEKLDNESYVGIDLGVNNICAITSNQHGIQPFLINGKTLKSTNQYFNKQKAKYQSFLPSKTYSSNRIKRLTFKRNNKIEDSLHKISRYIVDFCIENHIGNIVFGKNKEWKQECNIGRKNNQNFVNIPHSKLIDMTKYKAELFGTMVLIQEESYTSKCDALALEPIEKHDEYLGKRVNRGLFKSSVGKFINADIGGSLNILRKVISDDFLISLINRGVVFTPYKVNLY